MRVIADDFDLTTHLESTIKITHGIGEDAIKQSFHIWIFIPYSIIFIFLNQITYYFIKMMGGDAITKYIFKQSNMA